MHCCLFSLLVMFCQERWQWCLAGRHVIRKRPRRTATVRPCASRWAGGAMTSMASGQLGGGKTGTPRDDPINHPGSFGSGETTGPGLARDITATLGGEGGGEGEEGKSKTEEARRVGRVCLGSCCRGVARQEEKGMARRGEEGEGLTRVPSWGGGEEVSRA